MSFLELHLGFNTQPTSVHSPKLEMSRRYTSFRIVFVLAALGGLCDCLLLLRHREATSAAARLHRSRRGECDRLLAPSPTALRDASDNYSDRPSDNEDPSSSKNDFNTIVKVSSTFECPCSVESDGQVSLSDYMRLPVDQYVCIRMPLDATLTRHPSDDNRFDLVVPPVTFFNLQVSPTIICKVSQTPSAVIIESTRCILGGSKFVENLNGRFNINIKTSFSWTDSTDYKAILSQSDIYVEVDPPAPFKYISNFVLERTGNLALSIALKQIENAFVQSLSRDYQRWASDPAYRKVRAGGGTLPLPGSDEAVKEGQPDISATVPPAVETPARPAASTVAARKVAVAPPPDPPTSLKDLQDPSAPAFLRDDICLMPGEPIVRVEAGPGNSARIFTGIDIEATVDDIWQILTDYDNLGAVVPSLVKNEVLEKRSDGGATLLQIGGAKVFPGVTFTAKTVLNVTTYREEEPIPESMIAPALKASSIKGQREPVEPLIWNVYPRPYAITSLPHRDITMQNIVGEGDFDHYQGIWRIQPLPNCADDGSDAARLTYAVELKPKGFLPVNLIEGRIAADLATNLKALRIVVEQKRKERFQSDLATTLKKIESIDSRNNMNIKIGTTQSDDEANSENVTEELGKVIVLNAINSGSDAKLVYKENRLLRNRIADLERLLDASNSKLEGIAKLVNK